VELDAPHCKTQFKWQSSKEDCLFSTTSHFKCTFSTQLSWIMFLWDILGLNGIDIFTLGFFFFFGVWPWDPINPRQSCLLLRTSKRPNWPNLESNL
jgi:hypothetical protein